MATFSNPRLKPAQASPLVRLVLLLQLDRDILHYSQSEVVLIECVEGAMTSTFSAGSQLQAASQLVGIRFLLQSLTNFLDLPLFYILLPLKSLLPQMRQMIERAFLDFQSMNMFELFPRLAKFEEQVNARTDVIPDTAPT